MAWHPRENATLSVAIGLADRHRVDHALHTALEARLAEHEQELIGLVLGQLGGIDDFENVGAVHRQQDLVDLEYVLRFERDHFDSPGIGANRNHALAGEILGAFDAQAGFTGVEAFVVVADQAAIVETAATVFQDSLKQKPELKNGFEISSATTTVRAYQAKLLEMAQANMQLALEFAQMLVAVRSPVQFLHIIGELTTKRIAMFRKYSSEMIELSMKR